MSGSVVGHNSRILIVDDVEDITNVFGALLRRAGYEVVTAFSASQALITAQSERFDLVISDIGMPGIDGYELAAQLRALPGYRDTPLIAVSGFAEYDDRGRALAAGFNEYAKKPVNSEALLETVDRLCGNSSD